MDRSTKLLVGLIVVLAVGVYLVLPSGKERESSFKPSELNLALDSASIVKIEVQRPGKSVILENVGGKWMITSPVHYGADGQAVAQVIGGVRRLKVGSLVSSNPDKQRLFQVDSTGSKLTLTDRSGKSTSLIVGKIGPSYSEVYLRLADSKDVYLGEGLNSVVIKQELKDWRDKTIFTTNSDSIKRIAIAHRTKNFVLERDSAIWKLGKDTVATNVMTSALSVISNLHADDFVDTLYTPTTKPTVLRVQTKEEVTLNFYPQPPDSTKYFVQTSHSSQNFVLNKWTFQELLKPVERFLK